MLNKITMPSAGQTTDTLTIVRWVKSVGEPVKRGDILLEVETDKANLEVESFAKGTLLKILFSEGDAVKAGEVIALVGAEGDLVAAAAEPATSAPAPDADDDDYAPILPAAAAGGNSRQEPAVSPKPCPTGPVLYQASPAAKKVARDRNVSLECVAAATGKSLVKKADVLAFEDGTAGSSDYDLVPLTAMRRTIAARMLASTSTIPTYTVEIEADMTALVAMRSEYKRAGEKVAFHDLLTKCVASAIDKHPYINGSYSDEGLRIHKRINVGIAVAMDNGLIVPVVRDVRHKRIAGIARDSAALVEKARSGKLTQQEIQGGTITISNLGVYPVSRFTAIINPPESCILAVGGTINRPCLVDGQLQERPVATITATFDHRIIDGAYGAAFLADCKRYIENPLAML